MGHDSTAMMHWKFGIKSKKKVKAEPYMQEG
jgi:hypothetical protein